MKTTWMERFRDALTLLCGGAEPPTEACEQWIRNQQVDGADPLQEWVVDHVKFDWAQGITTIEAAQVLADQPVEGEDHEDRPEPEDLFSDHPNHGGRE